jgi:hypothetical protein
MLYSKAELLDSLRGADFPGAVAREAIAYALDFADRRLGAGESSVTLLRQGDGAAHDYFRYGLALRVGDTIGAADAMVKAVYLHTWGEPVDEMEAEPVGATSPLSLIVWVERETAALVALVDALDAALTAHYKDLVSPSADHLRGLLDVNYVESGDVRERVGYGAVITSTREKPLRVWPLDRP